MPILDDMIEAGIDGLNPIEPLAGMDIGQTVIIKDKTVVAVEAMEGTDVTIARAGQIAGKGCVMIKKTYYPE